MITHIHILHKIETIEKEVMGLKLSVIKKRTPTKQNVVSLKGILKGVEISGKDITAAKKSLYGKGVHNHKRQDPSKATFY